MYRLRLLTTLCIALLVLTGCQSSPPPATSPVIQSFSVQPSAIPAGVPITFGWSIEGSQLTCQLDVHGDGVVDYTISNCTSSSTATHTFPAQSSYLAQLKVTDATGQSATRTLAIVVGPTNLAPLITGFWVGQSSTLSSVAFYWSVSDPDGPTLTCQLDADQNGSWDYQGSCLGLNEGRPYPVRTVHPYSSLGDYRATLRVSDGYQAVERRLDFRVPLNRVPVFERTTLRPNNSQTNLQLSFRVTDPDDDPISCLITPPVGNPIQINGCSSHTLNFQVPAPGLYSVLLRASDGRVEASQTVSVDTRNLCVPEVEFGQSQDFYTGVAPAATAAGDLNNDGYLDVAVANYSSASVSLFLGSSSGLQLPRLDLISGNAPSSLAIADLDQNNLQDLISADWGSDTLSLFNNQGAGKFGSAQAVLSPEAPSQVVSADFNGDNRPDLAVANSESDQVSIFLGTGTGGLGSRLDIPVGISPQGLTTADFDGDGKQDLAVVLAGENVVVVLPGSGNGQFGSAKRYETGEKPISVAAALLNNDDLPDLVVANQLSHNLSIYFSEGQAGNLGSPLQMATGLLPVSIAAGDLNNDGLADLAVANSGSDALSLFLGAGNGLLGAAQLLPTRAFPSSVRIVGTAPALPSLLVTSRAENYLQVFAGQDIQGCSQ
jgi:hypothetical protein